jgi:hypothetical protein
MNTKNLYVIVSDGGDGSFYPRYTMSAELIDKLNDAYDRGLMDYDNGIGCDGDGFHYDTIKIPVECTAESMGIHLIADNYADSFFTDFEEESDED